MLSLSALWREPVNRVGLSALLVFALAPLFLPFGLLDFVGHSLFRMDETFRVFNLAFSQVFRAEDARFSLYDLAILLYVLSLPVVPLALLSRSCAACVLLFLPLLATMLPWPALAMTLQAMQQSPDMATMPADLASSLAERVRIGPAAALMLLCSLILPGLGIGKWLARSRRQAADGVV
ncbi:hypothetical protein [Chitinilyticum aquatile]|uniref:hypothetical protein n=1 Tax=Chitinilyticum aquatile TaxID=362520 RepID=UPI00041481B3|nr:hypothetical protein [Chitinilyticum aquatile]